jgi:hypothetical protein
MSNSLKKASERTFGKRVECKTESTMQKENDVYSEAKKELKKDFGHLF